MSPPRSLHSTPTNYSPRSTLPKLESESAAPTSTAVAIAVAPAPPTPTTAIAIALVVDAVAGAAPGPQYFRCTRPVQTSLPLETLPPPPRRPYTLVSKPPQLSPPNTARSPAPFAATSTPPSCRARPLPESPPLCDPTSPPFMPSHDAPTTSPLAASHSCRRTHQTTSIADRRSLFSAHVYRPSPSTLFDPVQSLASPRRRTRQDTPRRKRSPTPPASSRP